MKVILKESGSSRYGLAGDRHGWGTLFTWTCESFLPSRIFSKMIGLLSTCFKTFNIFLTFDFLPQENNVSLFLMDSNFPRSLNNLLALEIKGYFYFLMAQEIWYIFEQEM